METILDTGARIPSRAHEFDAGYDLYSREEMVVPANGSAIFDTGVHMAIPKGMAGVLVSKSGLNVKSDITSTGLIDSGYAGAIKVKLYNHGDKPYLVCAGDKISQIVIVPVFTPSLDIVNEFSERARGAITGLEVVGGENNDRIKEMPLMQRANNVVSEHRNCIYLPRVFYPLFGVRRRIQGPQLSINTHDNGTSGGG